MSSVELLGLDVGERRIGAARALKIVGIPEPLPVIDVHDGDALEAIKKYCDKLQTDTIVIGLPLSLHNHKPNAQTEKIKKFAQQVEEATKLRVELVDEALSTAGAEKWKIRYPDAAEDSRAACVILERYMETPRKI